MPQDQSPDQQTRPLRPRKRVNFGLLARSLFMTIKTTRNFWDALALIFKGRMIGDPRSQRIAFRNGITLNLNWREYNSARRIVFNGYVVRKLGELLLVEKGKMKLVGPPGLIDVVNEELDRVYACHCENKVVLDVGGFIGDTATLFSMWGARKVIIYEPVKTYHKFIKMNVMLNGFEAELHEEGVSDHEGYEVVRYNTLGTTLGLEKEGEREMTIRVKDVSDVIQESHADIAKFDCEGAETSLNGVTNETLRKIDTYLIEAHTPETKKSMRAKFKDAGFIVKKELRGDNSGVSVLLFKRNTSTTIRPINLIP